MTDVRFYKGGTFMQPDKKDLDLFKKWIDESNNIVFFGGAGVSTESGIPDFRSVDETLSSRRYDYPPETILSHSFFIRKCERNFTSSTKTRCLSENAKPNITHIKLAELEKSGKLSAVVTQNIDGLHQAAGSTKVYELHGSTLRNYCEKCHKFYDADYIKNSQGVPLCECGGIIKPDVVLYEEGLDDITVSAAVNAISNADMLIVGGHVSCRLSGSRSYTIF